MDEIVRYLCDFAAHFLSRSQVQFDTFTRAPLKKADHGRVRLKSSFFLSDQAGASDRQDDYEKN